MNNKAFIDSNIFIYLYSTDERKHVENNSIDDIAERIRKRKEQ
jgi:predicted nucleic acid-binding protein